MIHVLHDHEQGQKMNLKIEAMPLYGLERVLGEDDAIPNEGPTVKFKLFDDDGELYYSGILTDDDECVNQMAALRWGEAEAGAAIIKVLRPSMEKTEWVQEIA
jgi:hypothetical protein